MDGWEKNLVEGTAYCSPKRFDLKTQLDRNEKFVRGRI
jgi:hypothetical protein